ncbi:MAG: hypothetical protein HYU57_09490, partial [Micavibrio aeruginosavorus]|nr:hypothetical protein [Micavibrio aeruginosavorus]
MLVVALLFCGPGAGRALAVCASPAGNAGDIYYNTTSKIVQYCNGTSWIATGKGPGTGGGCASPAGAAGDIFYNTTSRVPQFCNGNEWVAMGPVGGAAKGAWKQVSAGLWNTCAVKTNGALYCWGSDSDGQLGNGATTGNQTSPVQESTAATDWASVSVGATHTCAVKTNGTLYCWGDDTYGELGNGATTGDQASPVQESTAATDWASVSAGVDHTCAVKTNGTLYCWGENFDDQLGTGGSDAVSPTQEFTAATDWVSVSAGTTHTCAVKTNGTLYCWGNDATGQLANGAGGDQAFATQESTAATNWASVSAGVDHTCAVKTNGTLYCWGADGNGQLGNGATTGNQVNPVQESTAATNWASVAAGDIHTCAVKTNGTLYCWGDDTNGQIGNGTTGGRQVSPVQESTAATDWASVAVD